MEKKQEIFERALRFIQGEAPDDELMQRVPSLAKKIHGLNADAFELSSKIKKMSEDIEGMKKHTIHIGGQIEAFLDMIIEEEEKNAK
jgi:peptidoglycan hydrolase CwlO-like protein